MEVFEEATPVTRRKKAKRHHPCAYCEKVFSRVEHRTRHERSHTLETPFACLFCPKSFARKDLLVRHTKSLHAGCSEADAINAAGQKPPGTTPLKWHQWQPLQTDETPHKDNKANPGARALATYSAHSLTRSQSADIIYSRDSLDLQQTNDTSQSHDFRPLSSSMNTSNQYGNQDELAQHDVSLVLLENNDMMDTPYMNNFEPDSLTNFGFSAATYSTVFQTAIPLWPTPNWSPGSFIQAPEKPRTEAEQMQRTLPTPASSRRNKNENDRQESSSLLDRVFSQVVTPGSRDGSSAAILRHRTSYVTARDRTMILQKLDKYRHVLPAGFVLPSFHGLNRYAQMYFDAGARHQPFIHEPTWKAGQCSISLLMAISALGARYCFEIETSRKLWAAGKSLVTAAIDEPDEILATPSSRSSASDLDDCQAMLLLMIYATWAGDKAFLRHAIAFQSGLAAIVREIRPEQPMDLEPDWELWTQYEAQKRTKFVAFCIFNLQCLAYDLPAFVPYSELAIDLPAGEELWRADNEEIFHERLRQDSTGTPSFQYAMRMLLDQNVGAIGEDGYQSKPEQLSCSIFGSYILINSLLQHGSQLRRYAQSMSDSGPVLSSEQCKTFERTLRRWQRGWENHPMASLDPQDAHGPLASNCTALLRMAYIRLEMNFAPFSAALRSGDPAVVARAIYREPPAQRSRRSMRAALHAWHALLIPIRIGIDLVARTQVFLWSIQHFIASFECCLLLAKWLDAVTVADPSPPLSDEERWLLKLVQETLVEVGIQPSPDTRTLSSSILTTWAKLFHGNNIWGILTLIGSALTKYAELLAESSSDTTTSSMT